MSNPISIFEKLSDTGTLFLNNIHHIDRKTQEHLTEVIQYGFYRMFKGEHKIPSNIRIICSGSKTPYTARQKIQFNQNLYDVLKRNTLSLPSLKTLPEEELYQLADGFAQQIIKSNTGKSIRTLIRQDKISLVNKCPESLHAFKTKVQHILEQKQKESSNSNHHALFTPASQDASLELTQLEGLGKKALKDPKIMSLLQNKFKTQNKIANFLGVNRSSVNRRCKEYKLDNDDPC